VAENAGAVQAYTSYAANLSQKIDAAAQKAAPGLKVRSSYTTVYGGVSQGRQVSALRSGVDIVVDHKILTRHPLVELDGLRCDIEGFGPIPRVTAERLGSSRPARAASCDGAGRVSAQTSTAARRSS